MGKNLLGDCTQRVIGCYLEPLTSGIAQGSLRSCLTYLLVTWAQNWGYQLSHSKADSDLGRAEEQANRGKDKWESWAWVRRTWHHIIWSTPELYEKTASMVVIYTALWKATEPVILEFNSPEEGTLAHLSLGQCIGWMLPSVTPHEGCPCSAQWTGLPRLRSHVTQE